MTTKLHQSEKKALLSFLSLYLFSMILFFAATSFYYYDMKMKRAIEDKKSFFQEEKQRFMQEFIELNRGKETLLFPEIRGNYTIIDNNKRAIFGKSLRIKKIDLGSFYEDGLFYFVSNLPPRFGRDLRLIIYSKEIVALRGEILKEIAFFVVVALICSMFIAYLLGKIFLRPLREKIELLDRFIKDSAHEMGTPISAIAMSCESLESKALEPKLQRRLEIIKNSAKTLSHLYDDLLLASFPQKFEKKVEIFEVSEVVKEILEMNTPFIEQKKITLKIEIESLSLKSDRFKLKKVVANIIQNAIKYNKEGGVLKITLKDKTLTIQDNGVGIEKEKLHRVFERYYRASSNSGGFGIGLSLVKEICEDLSVGIEVDSEIGVGTKVVLHF